MKNISFRNVDITDGFWKARQELNKNVTIPAVRNSYIATHRIEAFDQIWTPESTTAAKPHIFWDSDVAKWMESVCYVMEKEEYAEMGDFVALLVKKIIEHQDENGYYNNYYQVAEPVEKRFTERHWHELYCAGHLMEAACAYKEATGKTDFLDAMCKYADHIEKRFRLDKDTAFRSSGHEEIELALVKLAKASGNEHYLDLAKYFIDIRGTKEDNDGMPIDHQRYIQCDIPLREQTDAHGHAVRAGYIYCGMADIAFEYGDEELKEACLKIFDNIINRRMYVTGGVGSTNTGEAYSEDYDLPNARAYAETCAAISLALFARRMQILDMNAKYADTIERIIYNGFLSSTSLDGLKFFYMNPLEITLALRKPITEIHYPRSQRNPEQGCSCCPPNVVRFVASIGDMLYTADDATETVYVNQFAQSEAAFELNGKAIKLTQTTDYPNDGKINIKYEGEEAITVAVRVPSWCDSYENEKEDDGYIYFNVENGDEIDLDFRFELHYIESDPRVTENEGRVAVSYGPFIYCMERFDNPYPLRDIRIDSTSDYTIGYNSDLGVKTIKLRAFRTIPNDKLYSYKRHSLEVITAEFIPYYAFANRGENDMLIWTLIR